jgi:hypothetical protein
MAPNMVEGVDAAFSSKNNASASVSEVQQAM